MTKFKFDCRHCGKKPESERDGIGMETECRRPDPRANVQNYVQSHHVRSAMMSKKFLIVSLAALLVVCTSVFSGCSRSGGRKPKFRKLFKTGTVSSGTPEEQNRSGDRYFAQKNYTEAVKAYRQAAEQGHVKAQCSLGFCYEKGYGVPTDMKQALHWYRKSADQGDPQAQCMLGFHYMDSNRAEAKRWFRKAADQGDASAQSMLKQLDSLDRMRF